MRNGPKTKIKDCLNFFNFVSTIEANQTNKQTKNKTITFKPCKRST